jgi:hypothetical protein
MEGNQNLKSLYLNLFTMVFRKVQLNYKILKYTVFMYIFYKFKD